MVETNFRLSEVIKPFTISLRNLGDGNEKTQALKGISGWVEFDYRSYLGFLSVIELNPDMIIPHISLVVDVLIQWHGNDEALTNTIGTFLHYVKNKLGPQQWEALFSVCANFVKKRLVEVYKC